MNSDSAAGVTINRFPATTINWSTLPKAFSMTHRSKLLRNLAVSFALIIGLSCVSSATAQSGRRVAKPRIVVPAIPEPEPTPTPAKQSSQPTLKFILGLGQVDSFSSVSLNTASGVSRSCAQRLGEPEWITVDATQRTMTRSDAIKLAKAEKDSYVVWLQVREDTMGARQSGTASSLYIEYTVFAPVTAKVHTSGSTYPRNRNRNVILDRRPSDIEGDYYLNQAARDAADRILAKFSARVR